MPSLETKDKAITRSLYWDILKGVSILLVIIGHQIQYSCGDTTAFIDDPVFKFIYGFHMPLFMMIAGYFFYYSTERHKNKDILVNRLRQCILPIATITILVQIANLDFSPIAAFKRFSGISLWFLWAVFGLSCITLIIKKLNIPLFVVVMLYFITFFLPTFSISKYIWYMYPFFLGGYYFNKYEVFDSLFNRKALLITTTLISGLAYFVALLFLNKETYIYWSQYTVLYGGGMYQALVNIQRTVTGFLGSFFIVGLIRITYVYYFGWVKTALSYLGQNTLQLYVISTLPISRIEAKFGNGDVNYFLAFISFVAVLAGSIAIIEILKRFEITNFLFFGHKLKSSKGVS